MTIFISGPMSGLPDFNYPSFHEAGEYLQAKGERFFSPAHFKSGVAKPPPRPEFAEPWEYYMRQSLKQLLLCDRILMLPGWENSRGATIEKELAIILNMQIEYWNQS
ncbi:MAG: DUF4406 domain-containing protein [Corynebacterium casei]|uniref:DUF4406 domain-containing protein n=1 Tax=Corynebacterium casei TaxID=160386 RepID=UPI002648F250|nr:DUF4406 domain-containing protein [Corynebacterium casei]MDN6286080.1 DUF4406 domain-containing protein [Corynebacterium casei]